MKAYGHCMKEPNIRNVMNFGEWWRRSVPPEEVDEEKRRHVDFTVTMVIDPILVANPRHTIRKNIEGNVDVGIMAVNKEVDSLLPTILYHM